MKKSINTNAIVFAQASDNAKAVVAMRGEDTVYLAHALLTANKPIYEALGGTRIEGVKHFRVEFKTAKNAKAFIAKAICELSAKEYTDARKTEPKAKVEKKEAVPATAKGKKTKTEPKKAKGKIEPMFTVVTDAKGNKFVVPTSALEPEKKPTSKKAKGKVEATKPTVAPNAKVSKSAKAKTETKKATPKKTKGNVALTDAQKKALDIAKMSILNRAASAYSIANGGEAINFKDLGKSEKDLAKFIPQAKAGMLKSKKWAKAVEMGITEDMLGC